MDGCVRIISSSNLLDLVDHCNVRI